MRDLRGLTQVTEASVFKRGTLAATLRRTQQGVEFAYVPGYLAAPLPAIATTLPLTDRVVVSAGGAVPAFFAGLLPEGRRLAALRGAVKTSADDELSLLLAVGRDTVGDVQVFPANEEPLPPEPLIEVDRSWSEVRFAEILSRAGIIDAVGLPGVQDKASARMISVPVGRTAERFILKIDPPEFPHLVADEFFFYGIARAARLPAAHAQVVHDADERPGLLVRRFDRALGKDGPISLACEDACQVAGRWPADKYVMSAEDAVMSLADRCAARPAALLALFRQVCFAWLTGNGDQHAKNLAIVDTGEGEWRVSPAYDLPSSVPYGDRTTALTIQGRTRGLTRKHLLAFAGDIDLPLEAATRALDTLLVRTEGLERAIRSGGLPFDQTTSADLAAELRHRRRQAAG